VSFLPSASRAATSTGRLQDTLKSLPFRIAYETYVDGNWEIFVSNADGSDPVNLTRTPDVHEHYPLVSPDRTRICFSVDTGEGREAVRSLWVMDLDGGHRRKLLDSAREPFWSPDSRSIGFLHQEFPKFNVMDFYTKGMAFVDLATGAVTEHVNAARLEHLYNPGFDRSGRWIVATVHSGMGFDHSILLIEAAGTNIIDLKIPGCRPTFSPDGTHLAWGAGDHEIALAPIDLTVARPKIDKWSLSIHDPTNETYHVDWSPDSRFVSFSRGPASRGDPSKKGTFQSACEIVGVYAPGWNIWVVPADRKGSLELDKASPAELFQVTTNGLSNKESAWFSTVPAPK
jgi:Tol biopolymer transport system component